MAGELSYRLSQCIIDAKHVFRVPSYGWNRGKRSGFWALWKTRFSDVWSGYQVEQADQCPTVTHVMDEEAGHIEKSSQD